MRNALLAIVALVVGTSSLPAQSEARWAEKLFDRKTEHDFGNVARGTQMTHKFVFKNIYAVPLDVTITSISCGCTKATTSTTNVEPHATGYIEANMNGGLFVGSRTVKVAVRFSNMSGAQPFYSTAELRVTAFSRGDITFTPGEVDFGGVRQGQAVNAQVIQVTYTGPAANDWVVNDAVTNGLPVDAKLAPPVKGRGVVQYTITVSLKPDAPVGSVKGKCFSRPTILPHRCCRC